MARIPVFEIMSTQIPRMEPHETAEDAAARMVEAGSGCVVVFDQGNPVGIVTERDIVRKVVSERRKPAEVRLDDIMSSPLVWVPRHTDIMEAARQMARLGLRKLVVMHDGRFLGVVSARDILQIAPHLVEVTRELAEIGMVSGELPVESLGQASGYCESCKSYSDMLEYVDGQLVCPECRERME